MAISLVQPFPTLRAVSRFNTPILTPEFDHQEPARDTRILPPESEYEGSTVAREQERFVQ
jgi:hypothetical protein